MVMVEKINCYSGDQFKGMRDNKMVEKNDGQILILSKTQWKIWIISHSSMVNLLVFSL